MRICIRLIVALTLVFTISYANEQGFLVVSEDVEQNSFSKKELTEIFLGKKLNWKDGRRVHIGYSIEKEPFLQEFISENLGINYRRFKKYWIKKVFAGYGVAPKIFRSNKEVLEFISSTEGAVVFTPEILLKEGIKIAEISEK